MSSEFEHVVIDVAVVNILSLIPFGEAHHPYGQRQHHNLVERLQHHLGYDERGQFSAPTLERLTTGTGAVAEQDANVRKLTAEKKDNNFIMFTRGSVLPEDGSGHEHMSSFDYVYKLEAVRDWLFDQRKDRA